MTSAADTAEIIKNLSRLNGETKTLLYEVVNGMSRGRLSCEEVADATKRILAGADKTETLEELVQRSNLRIYEEAILDAS